jgi:hypothetical protein
MSLLRDISGFISLNVSLSLFLVVLKFKGVHWHRVVRGAVALPPAVLTNMFKLNLESFLSH